MNEWKELLKRYLPSAIVLIVLLTLNRFWLIHRLDGFKESYLMIVLSVGVVIYALLSNASYYSHQTMKENRFSIFPFLSFVMIANGLIAMSLIINRPVEHVMSVEFFLAAARFVFILGILTQNLTSEWSHDLKKMFAMGGVLTGFQLILWYYLSQVLNVLTLFSFVMNAVGSVFLLVVVIDAYLKFKVDSYVEIGIAFSFLLLAQIYMTLMPSTLIALIQGNLMVTFSMLILFMYLNKINMTLPKQAHENLQFQFNLYAKNLKRIIDKKTLQLTEVNNQFIEELEYAKKIQQSLLPGSKLHYRDVVCLSGYFPCERLSGDFYDVYRLDEDHIALYLLDVAGHGISAALMTMFSNNYLKTNEVNLQRYRGLKPDVNLKHFYEQFNKMNFPDEMHMVIFHATLNLTTRTLTYCSGGINCSPIHFKKNGKYTFLDKSKGFPICKLDAFFTPEFVSEKVVLEKGDRLLFYTDGLVDEEKNKTFSAASLIDLVKSLSNQPIEEVHAALHAKIGPVKDLLNDDITYVLLEV